MSKQTILIIGGGVSGLATAYWLQQAGVDTLLLEAQSRVGGKIVTERVGNYLIDWGANTLRGTTSALQELLQALALEQEVVPASSVAKYRFILRDGVLHPLPTHPAELLSTSLFSWRARAQLLKEPFIGAVAHPRMSVATFVRKRLGEEWLHYAVDPFVAGIFAGDAEQLSLKAAFPRLYALDQTYGSLIKGMIKGRHRAGKAARGQAIFSFKEGMATLVERLYQAVKNRVQLQTPVQYVERVLPKGGYRVVLASGETYEALQVVLAVPTSAMATMLEGMLPVDVLRRVVYAPVAVVFTAFRREQVGHPMEGFGFLVPSVENRKVLGSLWNTSLFPQRAPEGEVAMTTFVGGMRQPDLVSLEEQTLRQYVLEELQEIMAIQGAPVFLRIKRWKQAIPQYQLFYPEVQDWFDKVEEKYPGLYFTGNTRLGISIGDSIQSARSVAQRIIQSTGG